MCWQPGNSGNTTKQLLKELNGHQKTYSCTHEGKRQKGQEARPQGLLISRMTQCTNSLGWEVQQYSDDTGWVAMTEPFPTKAEAFKEKELYADNPTLQLRVYESLF